MKQIKKLTIVLFSFVFIMVLIILFFAFKYENIHLKNNTKSLVKHMYNLNEGNYIYKNGLLYSESGEFITSDYYINGNGTISIDKYKNIKLYITSKNKCISKTSLGKIKVKKGKCNPINIEIKTSKNNNLVSFSTNYKNLEYKISKKDDFKGRWIKKDYEDNIIINKYETGKYYVWFKDNDGNISDTIEFEINCLLAKKSNYNDTLYYCNGSTIYIDNVEWIVLDNDENKIKLMKNMPLDIKLSHCFNEKNDLCFYTKKSYNEYSWSKSKINQYLNNEYINTLSNDIKSRIIEQYICDNKTSNLGCDSDGCVGYLKSEIEDNNWSCENYTKSSIRLITFNEYIKAYNEFEDTSLLVGKYWSMNSISFGYGSSYQRNHEIFIKEKLTNELDIRPVITIERIKNNSI